MQHKKYVGKYITVTEEDINGHTYERATLRPGVHVIPIQDNKILFMNESRIHENGSRWKLVSGWCDKVDLSPLDHAKEELAEELGMQADNWEMIYDTNAPGATLNPHTYYFTCSNVTHIQEHIHNPDHGCEVLGHKWFGFQEILDAVAGGVMWMDDSALAALVVLHNQQKNKAS